QILSITCDNASNNTVMVEKLAEMLLSFPRAPNHTRCFLHMVNLVAKLLISEFDMTKKDVNQALEEEISE
ncbi:hypothetical protein C8R48DRAFT_559224, partial [Suillus tomentosus]